MDGESQPRVRVSLESASRLAAATAAAGALNTTVATFFRGDPLAVGAGDAAELTRVRDAGVSALRAAQVASAAKDGIDLDVVAEAAVETVHGTLWLALRALALARRAGMAPEGEMERLEATVRGIVELLPGPKSDGRRRL